MELRLASAYSEAKAAALHSRVASLTLTQKPYKSPRAQVELRLASAYSEAKAAALNDVLEEFFFDDGTLWADAPLPAGVRDITHEVQATMVRTRTL